jgi:sulfite exporter TauE/SafE/copper chaperone CopZ
MRCASCERLIEDELKQIPGVVETEVSLSKKKAGIRLAEGAPEPNLVLFNRGLEVHGYKLHEPSAAPVCEVTPTSRRASIWHAALAFCAVLVFAALALGPLRRSLPEAAVGASLIAALGLGVIASVSTCLASTGAFLLSMSTRFSGTKALVGIHAGRVITFIIGGALLGLLGGSLPDSTFVYGVLGLVLGTMFLLFGLQLLGWLPTRLNALIRLPRFFDRFATSTAGKGSAPWVVGAVTFFLPCGFTQTAQAIALASGSPVRGALFMGVFALGTLPVLAGLSAAGSFAVLRGKFFQAVAGAALVLMAFGQLDGGLSLFGSPVTFGGLAADLWSNVRTAVVTDALAQEQLIRMTVQYGAFSPNRFVIKKGVPVRWEVNGVDISGCASTLVSPRLGINQTLIKGLNVFRFTPKEAGSIPFSCSMGMIRGTFSVVD